MDFEPYFVSSINVWGYSLFLSFLKFLTLIIIMALDHPVLSDKENIPDRFSDWVYRSFCGHIHLAFRLNSQAVQTTATVTSPTFLFGQFWY